jgi:DNA repair exonuclease SbcCD ATPase subunit
MNQLNVYYRALLKYREQTAKDRDCIQDRNALTRVNTESDRIVLKRNFCTVDMDWVEAIEEGLVFIEKAIKEERQFIRSNGEVIPIEKVRNVSKASVEHLAKHSNLITREVEGEDLIPDQLFTVEKLNDYAVYENRFLYMLLCYLRDFVTLRYNEILERSYTYDGSMTMSKTVKLPKQTMTYHVDLTEERKDDKFLIANSEIRDIIDRIDLVLKAILAFLSCPLMKLVAKAPMLKPPITKTNVLKMNNNFKQAMALYGFIVSYDKPGYSIETRVTELSPFRSDLADEMAESALMASFLTYEYGLGINAILREEYEEEENRRKEEEYRRRLEKMEAVRRRVMASGESPEEYIIMLEKQMRILEERCSDLDIVRGELKETKQQLAEERIRTARLTKQLNDTLDALEALREEYAAEVRRLIEEKERAIRELTEHYETEIATLKAEHEREVQELTDHYETEIATMKAEHEREVRELTDHYETEIATMKAEHEREVRELTEHYETEIATMKAEHEREVRELTEHYETEIATMKAEHEREVRELTEHYETEISGMKDAHSSEIRRLTDNYEQQMTTLREEHAATMAEAKADYELRESRINQTHAAELAEAKELHRADKERLDQSIADLNQSIETLQGEMDQTTGRLNGEIADLKQENERLLRDKRVANANVYLLRDEQGKDNEDFTSQMSFDELERTFQAFKKFYKEQWRLTKKTIRADVLGKSKEAGADEKPKNAATKTSDESKDANQ